MATIAAAASSVGAAARRPKASVLYGIVICGVAAAGCTLLIALTSDHLREPGVHGGLQVWGMLGFAFAGVVAWWRRPESHLGLLMVLAGAVWFLSALSSANLAVPYTLGLAFDLLPAVVFLHVFVAFPTGRVERSFERALLAVGYVTAFCLQLASMTLGGFGSDNLLELASAPEAQHQLQRVQLVVLSGLCVAGVGVLAFGEGRPANRSVVRWRSSSTTFALGLLMLAFLFLSAAFGLATGEIPFETIRRATYFVLGLAPVVFLIGLLDARLARSAVGDLIVELRADPTPPGLRDALARTLRDPSLTLAYWLPEFGTYADLDGRPVELPAADGRPRDDVDRPGRRAGGGACCTTRRSRRARAARLR